jgi:hypothetical protein
MESVDFLVSCTSIYSIGKARKKTSPILLKSSARLLPGKDQPTRLTWLGGSRAWVLTEVALLRIYNMCIQQPASQAILRRSARSLPMFRANFLPFTSKIVEHSRYLPHFVVGSFEPGEVENAIRDSLQTPLDGLRRKHQTHHSS